MTKTAKFEVINREISWLSFNDRVLQEAADKTVPLLERIKFLGIFSNNLDEFFKVRVATLRRMESLGVEVEDYFDMNPQQCLKEINGKVIKLQAKFERIYSGIITELEENNVFITDEKSLTEEQAYFVKEYFREKVRSILVPIMIEKKGSFPLPKDKTIYLAVRLTKKNDPKDVLYSLIELPTDLVSRFLVLPEVKGKKYIIYLDDVVRYCLDEIYSIFDYDTYEAYTIKLTRDAELDIEEDISKSLMDKLEESLQNRKRGQFTRFVYDASMPQELFDFLVKKLKLKSSHSLIPGGRYHNFKDFIGFPTVGKRDLVYQKLPPLPHPVLYNQRSLFKVIKKQDVLLTYPFQSFSYIVDLLREAAMDPNVTTIKINIYRVAKNSKVMNALVNAARNGKEVIAVLELQARFDEKNNLYWSSKLQEDGIKVLFGVPGLKVHSKLIYIERIEDGKPRAYAHIGTGNFHEGNAKIYTDFSLLTADRKIAYEVGNVFEFFAKTYSRHTFKHLMVSPFNNRSKFTTLINNEIKNARAKKPAYILLKINNLVDRGMIKRLYDASNAGVKIRCIVRGICCLVPGVKGMSENIEIISIVDRFLEHTRSVIFANGGDERYFISSADWMSRNLDRRVEVTAPIYDSSLQKILKETFEIYWSDNVKARVIEKNLYNLYVPSSQPVIRSQEAVYRYFEEYAKSKIKKLDDAVEEVKN